MQDKILIHHGIRGQRWGSRNGPPYPLDSEDHSASEKKAGWRKSLDSNSDTKNQPNRRSDKEPTTKAERKEMSTNDLRRRIERLELEKKLSELEKSDSRKAMESGGKYALDILKSIGRKVIPQLATTAITYAVSQYFDKGSNMKNWDLKELKKYLPNAKNQW